MKKSRFTELQIVKILKSAEQERAVIDICREYGISVLSINDVENTVVWTYLC